MEDQIPYFSDSEYQVSQQINSLARSLRPHLADDKLRLVRTMLYNGIIPMTGIANRFKPMPADAIQVDTCLRLPVFYGQYC